MDQLLQIAGALCILTGFALSQARRLNADGHPYLLLYFVGSSMHSWSTTVDGPRR